MPFLKSGFNHKFHKWMDFHRKNDTQHQRQQWSRRKKTYSTAPIRPISIRPDSIPSEWHKTKHTNHKRHSQHFIGFITYIAYISRISFFFCFWNAHRFCGAVSMRRKAEIIIRCKKSIAILKTSIFSQSVCEWIFMACRQWSGSTPVYSIKTNTWNVRNKIHC